MRVMIEERLRAEPARKADAAALAHLIMIAGEGLPLLVWEGMRQPGESAMDVGARRAAREEGGFSYRHADVVRDGGEVISALVSYPILDLNPGHEIDGAPPVFRPLLALENALAPSWYVNVLATVEGARKRGAAGLLLETAEDRARREGFDMLTLITGDNNPARGLYERFGFRERTRLPIVKDGWDHPGTSWIAYAKPLSD